MNQCALLLLKIKQLNAAFSYNLADAYRGIGSAEKAKAAQKRAAQESAEARRMALALAQR